MKNIILSICITICALLSTSEANTQTIPASMLPYCVTEMQKQLPQKAAKGMIMTNVYLENNNTALVFEATIDEEEAEVTSTNLINEFQEMSPNQKKEYLGKEFAQIASLLPVPVFFLFKFSDGTTYKMKTTE